MTRLLEQLVAELQKLPQQTQDAVAARLLADVMDERAWMERFSSTSDAQWEGMAALARREICSGETTPLEDVFPPPDSAP